MAESCYQAAMARIGAVIGFGRWLRKKAGLEKRGDNQARVRFEPGHYSSNQFGTTVVFIRQFSGALNQGLSESQNSYGLIEMPFTVHEADGVRSRTS